MNKIKLNIQQWDTPICAIQVAPDQTESAFSIFVTEDQLRRWENGCKEFTNLYQEIIEEIKTQGKTEILWGGEVSFNIENKSNE